MGVDIPLQEGTRHTVISRLAEVLPLVVLQEQTRHRDARSLAHYTVGARPDPVAMVHAIRPRSAPNDSDDLQVPEEARVYGGADGTRTRNFWRDRPVL